MKNKTVAQTICEAASREQANYPKTWRLAMEDATATKGEFVCEPKYYYLVSIEDKPVNKERFFRFDPDLKFTKGAYSIQYIPLHGKERNPKFPYLIGQDLVRLRVTVSGPKHWGCLCQRIPELGWIKRNSTMTDYLFYIAKKHPGLVIKFGINFEKYCEKIERAAEEQGIDIDHKPLFMYQWNSSVKEELKKVDVSGWQKTKADYAEALLEVENSPTVQSEIKHKGE